MVCPQQDPGSTFEEGGGRKVFPILKTNKGPGPFMGKLFYWHFLGVMLVGRASNYLRLQCISVSVCQSNLSNAVSNE